MIKSEKVRSHLFIALSFLTLSGVVVAIISIFFFRKLHFIYTVNNSFHSFYEHFNGALNSEHVYLYKETLEHNYYELKESTYLEDFNKHKKEIHKSLDVLSSRKACAEFSIDKEIDLLTAELSKYETLFAIAVGKVKKKEFDDFEVELKLQDYVHELELKSDKIGLTNVLMLQKFEKEFLINKDEAFVMQLERKVKEISAEIWKNKKITLSEKVSLINLLDNYRTSFSEIIDVTYSKGFKNEQGLSALLVESKSILNRQISTIDKKLSLREKELISNIEKAFIIVILNIVAISIFIFFVYPRKTSYSSNIIFTNNVRKLSLEEEEEVFVKEHYELASGYQVAQ